MLRFALKSFFSLAALSAAILSPADARSLSAINRVSESSGVGGNQPSSNSSVSADGRYIVFQSSASNLVSGDTNGLMDVFLFDAQTGTTIKVSTGLLGAQADGQSVNPVISGDGSKIAFVSIAKNLVAGDTNRVSDVFVFDVATSQISRISVSPEGIQGDGASSEPSISHNGNLIAFSSLATNLTREDANDRRDVFVRNLIAYGTSLVSLSSTDVQGDDHSFGPSISADGSTVAFSSTASNLVAGDLNECTDVFVRHLQSRKTIAASTSQSGDFGNRASDSASINSDGRYVAFQSRSNNLVASDTNGFVDVFRKDLKAGAVALVSKTSAQSQVKFDSSFPQINDNGHAVVFESRSPEYVGNDLNQKEDIFLRNLESDQTFILSATSLGHAGNAKSNDASISDDSGKIVFTSLANNLTGSDVNGKADIFSAENPTAPLSQTITVRALKSIYEVSGAQPAFEVERSGPTTYPLTVYYAVSGSATKSVDYELLPGVATIAAGSSKSIIYVNALEDSLAEEGENITLTLKSNRETVVGSPASVRIVNDDNVLVNITAIDATAAETGSNTGMLQITRNSAGLDDLVVYLYPAGTAVAGLNYSALPRFVIIPSGTTSVQVPVLPLNDSVTGTNVSLIVQIACGPGGTVGPSSTAEVTITD